jgi:hypothetical protein
LFLIESEFIQLNHFGIIKFELEFTYINIISTWDMIDIYVCCLIGIAQEIVNKGTYVNARCENDHDGVFFSFFSVINNIFYRSILIFCNYVNIMWELYAQRAKGNKCESTL